MCKKKRNWSYNVTLVLMRQQVLYVLGHENTAQSSILIYVFMMPIRTRAVVCHFACVGK